MQLRPIVSKAVVASLFTLGWATASHATDYNIAVIQSLTGSPAFIGVPVQAGGAFAIDEINQKQLLGPGNRIVATVDDDAGTRDQAVSLITRKAVDAKNLLIVGPTTGAVAATAAAVANDKKIPVFEISNDPAVMKAGPWGFIMTQPSFVTLPYIANYTIDKLKVKSCAYIVVSDNPAYADLGKGFEDLVSAKGVKTTSYNGIRLTDVDFSVAAVKVVAENPECVYMSAPAQMTANIIIQLKTAGLNPATKLIGHNALASPDFITAGGQAAEGVYLMADWTPGGANDAGKAFAKDYQQRTGKPADNWAAVGYSQMLIVADVLKRAGANPTRESVQAALAATKNVPVVVGNGVYSYDENHVPHYGMSVLMVKNGAFVAAP